MRTFLSAKVAITWKPKRNWLNKALHPLSNEVSLNVGADFHLIPSEDARKRTKNVYPYMQFYFIEKKTKKGFISEISMIRC